MLVPISRNNGLRLQVYAEKAHIPFHGRFGHAVSLLRVGNYLWRCVGGSRAFLLRSGKGRHVLSRWKWIFTN